MSAPKTPEEMIDYCRRWLDEALFEPAPEALAELISAKVHDAVEALTKENAGLRRAVAVVEEVVRQSSKREITLEKERDDLRQMLADAERANVTFTPEWANVVWEPIVKLLAKHSKIPPGGSSYVEMLKRIIHERADLRARLDAINAVRAAIHYDCGADMARALNRALDLSKPWREEA